MKKPTQRVVRKGGRGGARPGAGRKPKGEVAGVSHRPRASLASRFPMHVTVKLRQGLPPLRRAREYAALRAAFAAGCERANFRLVHYGVLDQGLQMLVEATDRDAVSRGLQGLMIRVAKALNRLWGSKGSILADRYDDRVLKTPREVRAALRSVLGNGFEHRPGAPGEQLAQAADMFSSAPWFDGWKETLRVEGAEDEPRPVAPARTWLLREGWRQLGPWE